MSRDSDVYLTVRELDYKYYYWLDKLKQNSWKKGLQNGIELDTDVVIQKLPLSMEELGVVARLHKEEPDAEEEEEVAPVIFYHSQLPSSIEGYLFTFKTLDDANLTWSISQEGKEPEFTKPLPRKRGQQPFTLHWDSSTAEEGFYELLIDGYFLGTPDRIGKIIRFYHQPEVKKKP